MLPTLLTKVNRYLRESVANIRTAMSVALLMAALLVSWVSIMLLVKGPEALHETGLTPAAVVLLYFGGALVCGLAAGLLLRLARSALGALVVGYVTALVFFSTAELFVMPRRSGWPVVFIVSLMGAGLGAVAWSDTQRPIQSERLSRRRWFLGVVLLLALLFLWLDVEFGIVNK
jgi:hypothetical protein